MEEQPGGQRPSPHQLDIISKKPRILGTTKGTKTGGGEVTSGTTKVPLVTVHHTTEMTTMVSTGVADTEVPGGGADPAGTVGRRRRKNSNQNSSQKCSKIFTGDGKS